MVRFIDTVIIHHLEFTTTQGIGPTLIAFRVAEEPSQTKVNPTSRAGPLSRLTFWRTAQHSDTIGNSLGPHIYTSTIRTGSAQNTRCFDSVDTRNDTEAQKYPLGEQKSDTSSEKLGHITAL